MNGLILGDKLEMTNITQLTDKSVKNIKIGELEEMLINIPLGYKKAIVAAIKSTFTEKDINIVKEKHEDLGQFLVQVIWINKQKAVIKEMEGGE